MKQRASTAVCLLVLDISLWVCLCT